MSGTFLPDDYEWTEADAAEADALAERFWTNPCLAQLVRAETMNALKQQAMFDPENADIYERAFEEVRQEALDAERSAHRALGIRGRVRAWYRSHKDGFARGALQRLSRLVRRIVASLPGL